MDLSKADFPHRLHRLSWFSVVEEEASTSDTRAGGGGPDMAIRSDSVAHNKDGVTTPVYALRNNVSISL